MNRVLAVANQKGGVGKTTTAINLGASLAVMERRVLLVDCDPQGNATRGLGVDAGERHLYHVLSGQIELPDAIQATNFPFLDVVPAGRDLVGVEVEFVGLHRWQWRLKNALSRARGEYATILLDCPPSLGHLTVNALVAADGVVVPLQCEYFALEGISALVSTVGRIRATMNPGLTVAGILLTMHDERTNLSKDVAREVRKHFGDLVYETIVPRNVRLAEAPSFGVPVLGHDVKSRGAEAYLALAREVVGRAQTQRNSSREEVMDKKRGGLGRGLDALLDTTVPVGAAVQSVELALLTPNRLQPRSDFDDAGIEELAESIRRQGIVQPVVVTPNESEGFTIIAGERRWRAARRAGLQEIPVVVKEVEGDRQLLEMALVENLQRTDLNAIEEAEAFQSLQKDFGLSQEEVGIQVGRSRSAISNSLRLLGLPDEIQDLVRAGQLSAGQARPLLAVSDAAQQLELARRAAKEGLSARELEALTSGERKPRRRRAPRAVDPDTAAAAERLTRRLQTKVEIRRKGSGGSVNIHFHSEEELIRLFDLLLTLKKLGALAETEDDSVI